MARIFLWALLLVETVDYRNPFLRLMDGEDDGSISVFELFGAHNGHLLIGGHKPENTN